MRSMILRDPIDVNSPFPRQSRRLRLGVVGGEDCTNTSDGRKAHRPLGCGRRGIIPRSSACTREGTGLAHYLKSGVFFVSANGGSGNET